MFRKSVYCLFFLCFWFTAGYGQKLEISYQHIQLEGDVWETKVFMQALAEDSMIIRAVNFSFLADKSCASFQKRNALFPTYWSKFLERQVEMDSVDIHIGEKSFNHRLLYLIAEPIGLPGTETLKIPGSQAEPLQVLSFIYKGTCANAIMMEDEAMNPINQIGDEDIRPAAYNLTYLGEK